MAACERCFCPFVTTPSNEEDAFCEWCNPIVEFMVCSIAEIVERFRFEPSNIKFRWDTTTAIISDPETGDQWEIEFRKI